ncbi:ATPase [Arthrobacter sp. RT-1]|uniref:SRPBCC domain-containing protein n=1 Tax=Arthrobacter sp. RT-1 TaxID=2292263 RepID=UPI000E1F158B|nr:SRPBCC domain-containing protein [Arthrobacter sp. RT-1]RDV11701.1 ATPase [Arthrobacter sp. RT-1]
MPGNHVATSSTVIDAPASHVWDVITDPGAVKEFMFGADLVTDWTVGGPMVWRGEWEGKAYEDKGYILEVEPGQRLVHTHFSPLGGEDDKPENYHTLTWTLEDQGGATRLTLSQDNNSTEEAAAHAQGMWDMLVADVKKIAERG